MEESRSMTGNAAGLEKCCFFYDKSIQDNWAKSDRIFLNYAGSTCGQSTKVLLIEGELMVKEVDRSLFFKFKTEEAERDYLTKIKF